MQVYDLKILLCEAVVFLCTFPVLVTFSFFAFLCSILEICFVRCFLRLVRLSTKGVVLAKRIFEIALLGPSILWRK